MSLLDVLLINESFIVVGSMLKEKTLLSFQILLKITKGIMEEFCFKDLTQCKSKDCSLNCPHD